jgi:hypothetical protein
MSERSNLVNAAVGVCIVGLGVVLLLHSLGVLDLAPLVRYWPILLVVLGAAVTIQALREGERPSPAPIGFILLILLGGFLASHLAAMRASGPAGSADGQINVVAVMSGSHPPAPTGPFAGGQIGSIMGGTEIDLRQATIAPGTTPSLDLFTVMGGVVIRVPENWRVDSEAVFVMGGMSDKRPSASDAARQVPDPSAPRLVIKGTVIMGGLTVR